MDGLSSYVSFSIKIRSPLFTKRPHRCRSREHTRYEHISPSPASVVLANNPTYANVRCTRNYRPVMQDLHPVVDYWPTARLWHRIRSTKHGQRCVSSSRPFPGGHSTPRACNQIVRNKSVEPATALFHLCMCVPGTTRIFLRSGWSTFYDEKSILYFAITSLSGAITFSAVENHPRSCAVIHLYGRTLDRFCTPSFIRPSMFLLYLANQLLRLRRLASMPPVCYLFPPPLRSRHCCCCCPCCCCYRYRQIPKRQMQTCLDSDSQQPSAKQIGAVNILI
ncbi:unnamed protein product [Ectocarpus sp. 12 AP-2014]